MPHRQGIHVTIAAVPMSGGVRFEISDTPGIAASDLHLVFDRFWQVADTPSSDLRPYPRALLDTIAL
jgi:signal transduction histidine kinase